MQKEKKFQEAFKKISALCVWKKVDRNDKENKAYFESRRGDRFLIEVGDNGIFKASFLQAYLNSSVDHVGTSTFYSLSKLIETINLYNNKINFQMTKEKRGTRSSEAKTMFSPDTRDEGIFEDMDLYPTINKFIASLAPQAFGAFVSSVEKNGANFEVFLDKNWKQTAVFYFSFKAISEIGNIDGYTAWKENVKHLAKRKRTLYFFKSSEQEFVLSNKWDEVLKVKHAKERLAKSITNKEKVLAIESIVESAQKYGITPEDVTKALKP